MTTLKDGMLPENRPATAQERSLIEWLLHQGNPGSEGFLQQVESLLVTSKCACGCPTVYFSREGEPTHSDAEHILADFLATVDGEDVGVILFQRGGRLSSLEVYSQAGTDKPFGLPEIETLYSWEELPERQRNKRV